MIKINNTKVHIIHTLPSVSNEASGPSYSVSRLCESLNQLGESTELITLSDSIINNSLPNFLRTFPYGFGPKKLGNSPAMKIWLQNVAKQGSIKLLHNHSLWMMPNVYPGMLAAKYSIPYVVSPRGCFTEYAMSIGSKVKNFFWPLVQKPTLKSVGLYHATAESEYEDIRRMGFRQPVAIIPNGIDLPNFKKKLIIEHTQRSLLFLGRIHPNKGLDMLLPAWKAVQDSYPNWNLCIAGPDEGGYLSKVKKLSSELCLERIHFLGPVYGESKWKMYVMADLFILPSYSENFGMTVAESLAAGTPAIVFKGAPWQGLEHHNAGWWVDVNINALIECLKTALGCSKEQLYNMGDNGKEWMTSEYSWQIIAKKMQLSYDWLLTNTEKPNWIVLD